MIEPIMIVCVVVLGIFAGSMLTEAFLLVPFFRSLEAKDFYALHHAFGPRLYRYYAPVTIAATCVPILSAIAVTLVDPRLSWLSWLVVAISLSILSTYFLYFRRANLAFAEQRIAATDLGHELATWSRVHSFRTLLALVSFVVSIFAVLNFSDVR